MDTSHCGFQEYSNTKDYQYSEGLGLVLERSYGWTMGDWNEQKYALVGYIKGQDTSGVIYPDWEFTAISKVQSCLSAISLYPNPAYNSLIINYNIHNSNEIYTFSVIDITGRELVPQTSLYSSTTYEIPIADWAKGLYIVRVQDEKGNFYTEKFIKE